MAILPLSTLVGATRLLEAGAGRLNVALAASRDGRQQARGAAPVGWTVNPVATGFGRDVQPAGLGVSVKPAASRLGYRAPVSCL